MDLVAWYHLKAFENSSLAPFARAMCSMVPEERFHASFGANRVRRLVDDPAYLEAAGGTRADVETSLRKWYPRALDTFGASKSRFSDLAVRFGIRRWGNEELRQMYLQDINPLLLSMGLQPPAPEWDRHVL
jgi:ring-1,2-phenylacetyl-CoA epoxidase subunit PaaA